MFSFAETARRFDVSPGTLRSYRQGKGNGLRAELCRSLKAIKTGPSHSCPIFFDSSQVGKAVLRFERSKDGSKAQCKWSKTEDERLLAAWAKDPKTMHEVLGRSKHACEVRLFHLGVTGNPKPGTVWLRDLAQELRVDLANMRRTCRDRGWAYEIFRKLACVDHETEMKIRAHFEDRQARRVDPGPHYLPVRRVAEIFNVTDQTIHRWLAGEGQGNPRSTKLRGLKRYILRGTKNALAFNAWEIEDIRRAA